ncbi:MAG: FeoA family protein [Bacteroidota bacterium]
MASIGTLKKGQKGIIKPMMGDQLPVKLMELGCLPGNLVQLLQVAPLHDPIYINVNGSHIAIRKAMALCIEIDIVEDTPLP